MKILYVVHQFFPHHYTGTERLTLQLAKQIQRMGHHVSILTSEPLNIKDDNFKSLDNFILKKTYYFESVKVISFQNREYNDTYEVFNDRAEKYLIEIIKNFDVVHFTHPMRNGIILKICKEFKIPTILTLTDYWLLCPQQLITKDNKLCDGPEEGNKCIQVCNLNEKILQRYSDAKLFFDSVDVVFTGTEFVKKTYQSNNWKNKIAINTFSMDYSHVNNCGDPNELIFAYIGTISWHKGLHVLIESFMKISGNNVKLKIFGSGDEKSEYVKSIRNKVKNDSRIEFCGVFEYEKLSEIMKA